MFDNGSRGPIGSLRLLFMLRGRSLWASLGALIIFLLIAVDPFNQQLIHYSPCLTTSSQSTATSSRASIFQSSNLANRINPDLQAASNRGLYESSESATQISCPSGACNFTQSYNTVGYCAVCSDMSNQVTVNTNSVGDSNTTVSSLPSGTSAATSSPPQDADKYFVVSPTNGAFEFLYAAGSPIFDDSTSTATCNNAGTQNSWYCTGVGAASCSLQPCTRTYTAEVVNGKVSESLVSTSSTWGHDNNQSFLSTIYVPCLSSVQINALVNQGYAISNSTIWFPFNRSIDPSTGQWIGDASTQNLVPKSCIYQMSTQTNNDIQEYMSRLLSGSVMANGTSFDTNPAVESFYNSSLSTFLFVQTKMNNIADALTNHIRSNAASGFGEPATGTVYQADICIDVVWPWAAFSAVLIILTTVFLFGVLIKTRPATVRGEAYKSSPLPLIFHRVDRHTLMTHNIPALSQATHFEQVAKNIPAKLKPGVNGWQLSHRSEGNRDSQVQGAV